MTSQPPTDAPDLSERADTRSWVARHRILAGTTAAVLLLGTGAALAGGDEPAEAVAAPIEEITVTETVTASPGPAETVTVTVTGEPEPAETVTVAAEPEPAETVTATVTAEPEPAETVTVTAEPVPQPAKKKAEPEPKAEPESSLTRSQENAVDQVASYLEFSAFSRTGLIEQLEYEGYSNGDATLAVDSSDVDWKRQAAIQAEDYLEFSSFSRSGLIEQLEYEGFTSDQARYGVDQTGL